MADNCLDTNPPAKPKDKRARKESLHAANRRKRVVELRDDGSTWQEIAVLYDIGITQARRDYYKALADVPAEAVRQHRVTQNERLEWLWDKARDSVDAAPDPAAINAAVNVLKRQATLNGIDAPTVVHVETGIDLTRIRARIQAMTVENQ